MAKLYANNGDPNQILHSAASDLGALFANYPLRGLQTTMVQGLTLKTPRKPASENVVCLCRLLNILANFSNLFLNTGKQCGLRSDHS